MASGRLARVGRPEVRAQLAPADGALGRGLDADGELRAGAEGALGHRQPALIQGRGKVGPAAPNQAGKALDGYLEGMRVSSHPSSVVCDTILSSPTEIAYLSYATQHERMRWPQQPVFRSLVLEHRKTHALRPEDFAELIGVEPAYLHNMLYDKRVYPSLEALQRAADVLKVPISRLVDDKHGTLPGAEGAPADRLSVAKRAAMLRMYQNLERDDVSDDDAMKALEIVEALFKAGKIRKPQF